MALLSHPSERRFEPRRAANTRGVIVAPGLEIPCRIVDLSSGGYRVRLERAISLPAQVVLIDMAEAAACEADVAWCKGMEAGLKCRLHSNSLRGLVPARFTPARDAWMRAGGR